MSPKTLGYVSIFVGLISAMLGTSADSLGIGATPGLGYAQIGALVIGIILLGMGSYFVTHVTSDTA